jgi:alkylation response protein AidB-like acyl-CoA dehydrogenase
MDFDFSDDQEQLRDAVRKWVDKGYDFERRRKTVAAGGFDRAAYNELAELGLAGLYISEADGGMGMGPVEGMVVMEELGRGIVMEPLTQTLIAGGVLSGYGSDALKAQCLPKIASGETLVVLAYQERKARYRLDVCEAKATLSSAGWSLSATKNMVPAGDQADAFIVPATVDGTIALFLVERAASGVTTRGYGTQDGARAADLQLVNAPASLITTDGLAALEHAIDIGIAAACAEAVGVMDKTVAITAEYINTRKQFGVTIGSFQALRHRMQPT